MPFVIAADGTGSSYVVGVQETTALLVTNRHVVENPLEIDNGRFVLVLFYDDELAREEFSIERVKGDRASQGRRKHQPGDPDRPGGVLRRARD